MATLLFLDQLLYREYLTLGYDFLKWHFSGLTAYTKESGDGVTTQIG